MGGEAALPPIRQPVAQPDVGEGAADHHLVIAPPGAVGVEVADLDGVITQVARRRRGGSDAPRRGDVVGGDGVAEIGERPGGLDVAERLRLALHLREEAGLAHIGRIRVPLEHRP